MPGEGLTAGGVPRAVLARNPQVVRVLIIASAPGTAASINGAGQLGSCRAVAVRVPVR